MRAVLTHEKTKRSKAAETFSLRFFVCFVLFFASSWLPLGAQAPASENVTLAPIQCWTRTDRNAVRVGETFTLVLTCGVVETQSTTVVPDQSRLDPGALQVPPFEVVSGTQAPDLRTRTHRYFQYEYQLRFIGEQIGADIDVPGPTINYRVQTRVQGSDAIESRDRQYNLPAQRMRIASLVPLSANDIHDDLPETFREIEDRRFQANLLRIVSWVLFGVGAVVVIWALAGLVKRPKTSGAVRQRLVPESAVLRAAQRELDQVRRQRQADGWTPDLAARALSAVRLAASYAAGRTVPQTPASRSVRLQPDDGRSGRLQPALHPGQLRVTHFFPRPRTVVVSGAGTGMLVPDRYTDLRDALEKLSAAVYGRPGAVSESDLDEALDQGSRGIRDVGRRYTPWARAARSVKQSAMGVRDRAWAR
jgi:hypothetical protein